MTKSYNQSTLLVLAISILTAGVFFAGGTTSAAAATNPFSNNKQGLINYLAGLSNNPDNRVISGQNLGSARTERLWKQGVTNEGLISIAESIYAQTGQWVGLVGFEYTGYEGLVQPEWVNPTAIDYWNQGGLVQMFVHFFNPQTGGNYSDTSTDPLKNILISGTTAYNNFKKVLDDIAAGFQDLEDHGVIVLWRPFHEMNFAWFWWGHRNPDDFKKLWQYTYNYLTVTKGLSNLIWLYAPNSQTTSQAGDLTTAVTYYYPGDQYVDLVGLDSYGIDNPANIVGYSELVALGKPFVFGELGPPNVSSCQQSCYDYAKIVPMLKQYFPKTVNFMAWGGGARMDKNLNVKALLDDPWVLNRGELGGAVILPAGGSACHLLDSAKAIPTGFGASYNVLTTAKELLLKANCATSSADFQVGNGNSLQYIYNRAYLWNGAQWEFFTLSCSNLISGAWCVGNADYTWNRTSAELANTNYYAAYVCNWIPSTSSGQAGEWKCGCRDAICSTNCWSLQAFKK